MPKKFTLVDVARSTTVSGNQPLLPRDERELFSDPDICSTCHVRLSSRDAVPVNLENIKPGCALCRVLMQIVSEAFHQHNGSPQSARFVTEPLQDGRRHPLAGLGPYGANDLLLRLWYETRKSKLSHSSLVWITQLPIPDTQLPPNPTSIDYGHFRRLIDECIKSAHPQCTTDHSSGEMLVVRLIDCEQWKLVSAGNEPYVTLSYVWGAQSASDIPTTSTSSFPQTIEDSIAVTLAMGYKYLWVDRYCIDQDNKLEG